MRDFPDVALVNRDDNQNEAHKIITPKMKLEKVKVTYDVAESRSQRSKFAFDPINISNLSLFCPY